MTAPTIADMLKYANLQMAAEALYKFNAKTDPNQLPGETDSLTSNFINRPLTADILTDGNLQASRFTQIEADKFVALWEVVDHLSNTTTGFSGTLFKNKSTNELVLSIRSTEFLDDAVRDSYGTNKLELKDHGWAFGQISDMEAWYAQLSKAGGPLAGKHFSVTGYSLGGHLATAFNLLRQEDGTIGNVDQVVTFNGAGVGQVTGKLGDTIKLFNDLRASDTLLKGQFTDSSLGDLYLQLRGTLADGHKPAAADYALLDSVAINQLATEFEQVRFSAEKVWLRTAMDNIKALQEQVAYMANLSDTTDGNPAKITNDKNNRGHKNNRGQTTVFGEFLLSAGMQSNAEVLLGMRTVVEYLLSPVRKAWHEAGRER